MRSVKESSDELNPPVVSTGVTLTRARGKRSAGDVLALGVATWGVGYLPLAPGTWGSAVGVSLYLLLGAAGTKMTVYASSRGWAAANGVAAESFRTTLLLFIIVLITAAGIWAATRAEKLLGRKDPGVVVVDEVAGQLMAFLFVPWRTGAWAILAGFLAFRLFDIWKPYPIRRLEALESGLGIMADDVLAGAYAAALMALLVTIHLWL